VRLIGLLAAAFAAVAPASALAVTNSQTYSVSIAIGASESSSAPAPLGLQWTQHLDTVPPGNQPDIARATTILLPGNVISNGQYFPSCSQAEVDGHARFPDKCVGATVGYGSGTMYAGSAGASRQDSVAESVDFRLVNGSAGGPQLLLVVSSKPGAPVTITNRVMPGTSTPGQDPYGFAIRFDVPADLQQQLGLSISIADVNVTIPGTVRLVTTGNVTRSLSYLEIAQCGAAFASRASTEFRDSVGAVTTIASDTTTACALGSFPDPYQPQSADLPPPVAGTTMNVAPATPCDAPDLPPVSAADCAKLCPNGCSVRARFPGSAAFLTVSSPAQIPIGAVIDARSGAIRVTTAGVAGKPQTGIFHGGVFKVAQAKGRAMTEVTLSEALARCPRRPATRAAASPTKRDLWSNVRGQFRTRGRYAVGTALAAKWLTRDQCAGTLVQVAEHSAAVRDLARGRTFRVRAGHSYLARSRR
jgi:hypothetical protein